MGVRLIIYQLQNFCTLSNLFVQYSGWFREETEHDTVQPTIDMLLNLSVFFWFGAVCPWPSFSGNDIAPLGRLVPLAILILLFRRPPVMLLLYKFLPQIADLQHALFVGFFGPIGVSAVFNLGIVLEFFKELDLDESEETAFAIMEEQVRVVVWFMVMASVVSIDHEIYGQRRIRTQ